MRSIRNHIYTKINSLTCGDHSVIATDAKYSVSAPLDELAGKHNIIEAFYKPLQSAFEGLHRRDLMFIGGINKRDVGGYWIASVTHYAGNFVKPLWYVEPSDHLVMLRCGEFYRISKDGESIVEAKIICDLPDLLRQCGKNVFQSSYGSEITFPAPLTMDGVLPENGDSQESMKIMERMFGDLHAFDAADFSSSKQTGSDGAWSDNMMWYGPCGIGSNYRWSGFVKDHRASFLTAFPDRKGGNHYCRISDARYSAASGWPSMTMTFVNDYLGITANQQKLTLRVMDFYRNDGSQLCENWVFLDYVDLFRQCGINILNNAT